jgi:RimJ/RimL family protein N-acetyltransferase
MHLAVPSLADDVITLRPPAERDIDAITAACQDPAIPRFTRVPDPYTRDDAVDFVKRATHHWQHGGEGVNFAITEAESDVLVGMIGLLRLDQLPRVAEIGYWVGPQARRRRIATRAVTLVSRWAVREVGVARLELMTRIENVASQGVATAAGFTREGLLRAYAVLRDGKQEDVVMFSLLPGDIADASRAAASAGAARRSSRS